MIYFWLTAGLFLPVAIGWLSISLLQAKTPVLLNREKIALSFLLGPAAAMFITFLAHITGLVSLSLAGFLSVQLMTVLILGLLWWFFARSKNKAAVSFFCRKYPVWVNAGVIILMVWMAVKLAAGFGLLTMTPVYHDDVFNNWNMRGKIYYMEKEVVLDLEVGTQTGTVSRLGVGSYPPFIPMFKAWLADLNGDWDEGLVNSIHFVWYLAVLALMYFFLRRFMPLPLAAFGMYVLSSLPLYQVHGSSPYIDVYFSGLLLAIAFCLHQGFKAENKVSLRSWWNIAALTTGLLTFTKNEGVAIYLPAALIVIGLGLFWRFYKKEINLRSAAFHLVYYGLIAAVVFLPWLIYKIVNGLTFGNAKSVSLTDLSYHADVLPAVWNSTFFMGNWLLLPALFLILIVIRWKQSIKIWVPLLFVLIAYLAQLFIYMFTPLATEAVHLTGYSRGLIQLMPIMVFIVVWHLNELIKIRD